MFSRFRGFLNRHKRKFIVSGVVLGGFILITRYTQRKLREWQEKEVRELLERTRRSQHFESTERTCDQTILTLGTSVRNSVTKVLDTETIVNKLRNGCTDKVATWNHLKILAISRSAVIIYAHAMLVATLRIQLNLVGGYMFKASQNTNITEKADEITQQKYMSLCGYFMDEGIDKLCALIKEKVEEITASTSLRDKLTLRDLEQIYWSIMSLVSADSKTDPVKNLTNYMIPPSCEKDEKNLILTKMINETLDLLESEEVENLIQTSIRSGFVLIIDHISEYFGDSNTRSNGVTKKALPLPGTSNGMETIWTQKAADEFVDLNKIAMPMAKIIPIINGQVPDVPTSRDVPSDWLQRLTLNDKLKTLGANVYEAFSF
ncbi:peroxisomal biogenesis factor 3 [Leptopilina heterotoma]|uniref:peroxisomal biogenesis factor 3 n=1 Tax=Leptopilina heterotoma TaxID=63436 RepID=UPI001CA7B760|nr:peroxisomal biogenesis factor 3 [Leptopilina heterotoma]